MMADRQWERVVQGLGPGRRLLGFRELAGGVSASVTLLELGLPDGRTERVVVRRHGEADRQARPNVAAEEYRVLQLLHAEGMAVPAPILLAEPYLVVEYIEGKPEMAPADLGDYLRQLAKHLARLHQVDWTRHDLSFLPETTAEAGPGRNPAVLLHGDFWPGNVLWRDRALAAIIDWEDAAVGDPLADVGNARLELLWAFGREAMEQFTREYRSMTAFDFASLPWWDLHAVRRLAGFEAWAASERVAGMREQYAWFVAQSAAEQGRSSPCELA